MTALTARNMVDGSKPDTANGVNVANLQAGLGNLWDCVQSLGIGVFSITSGIANLTQANAGLSLVDATAGNVTINLPAANAAVGALFQFKRVDASANSVTINRAGADTIDAAASLSLLGQHEFESIRSDGVSAWKRLSTLANLTRARGALGIPGALQSQTDTAFTTAGTATAYTLTPSTAVAAYAANQSFFITFHAASGASPTLQISGLAAPPQLVKQNPDGTFSNIAAGDIPINHRSQVTLISAAQAWVETLPDVSLGRTQTVQDVTASRSLSTVFTNTTGRPIFVHFRVSTTSATTSTAQLTVAGITYLGTIVASSGISVQVSAIVPAGATYSGAIVGGTGTLNQWLELR